jgi:hypothetical protein
VILDLDMVAGEGLRHGGLARDRRAVHQRTGVNERPTREA